jgi:hypothetical protein
MSRRSALHVTSLVVQSFITVIDVGVMWIPAKSS